MGARKIRYVRNQVTGRILPCCYLDCEKPGNAYIAIRVRHPQTDEPEFRGIEALVYIFCSDLHRAYYVNGVTEHRRRDPLGVERPTFVVPGWVRQQHGG